MLKAEFSSHILGGFEMTTENAHQIFQAVVKKLEGGYSELTHYVPCSVVAERSYETFAIGPVTFVLRDLFFKQNEAAIRQELDRFGDGSIGESLLAQTRVFYSDFQWIASITVPPCDREISARRARAGIQKALDVFKLIVGSERAGHVKQGHDVRVASRHVELVSSRTEAFSLRFGTTGQDAITNKEWFAQVTGGPAWRFLEAVLWNYWKSWGIVDEIQLRFLDALSWHSDAISETDLGSRIIKFWVAIERLLSASPGDKITTRAAVLTTDETEDFLRHSKELEKLYQKRSAIVHGSANRANESWYQQAAKASEAASQTALYQYLYAIPRVHASRGLTPREKLTGFLRWLDAIAKQHRKQHRE